MSFNNKLLSEICEGCLSVNRKISVTKDDLKQLFISFVDSLECFDNTLRLCWECEAVLKKIIKYKRQVQNAQRHLNEHMIHRSTNLPTLSQLKTHTNTQKSDILFYSKDYTNNHCTTADHTNDDGTELPDVKLLESNHRNSSAKSEVSTSLLADNVLGAEELEPVFIKVEEDEFTSYNCEEEGLDAERNCDGDFGDDDAKYLKVSPPPPQPEVNTRRRRRKKEIEFNESDDEPLKKSKEREGKTRKRKRNSSDGSVRREKPREKAPGVVTGACVARNLQQLGIPSGHIQMVVLSWEEVESERQKALASEAFTRHEFRCELCAVGFNHSFKLANHMAKHDHSAGELVCSVCKIRCPTQNALTAHRRRHRVRWRCVVCGASASRASVLADKCAKAHLAPSPVHKCSLCGHSATSLSKLRNHLKNHAERQKCELCGKTFRDKSTLKTHLFIHNGVKEHACGVCGKMFLFKKAMQLHALTHDGPAHLYCYQCDMNFKNQMSFYQHMKYNLKHVDPAKLKYQCKLCDKKFMKASRLEEHNTAVHLKQTPIRCTVEDCSFACASRPVLRSHIRMIHRNMRGTRNYVCHHCGKAYTSKKTLEGHLRSHTGERPYCCSRCEATFRHHAALYKHTRLVHLRHEAVADSSSDAPQWPTNLTNTTNLA